MNLIVGLEIAFLFTVRGLATPAFALAPLAGTRALWWGVGGVVLAQLAFTYAGPWQQVFGTAPLGVWHWGLVAGAMLGFWVILEAIQALSRPRGGN